jgi:predicted dehydrogenase
MKLGVIGLGNVAQIMIEQIKTLRDLSITHVCDVSEDRVRNYSRDLQAMGHTDYQEMLKYKDIDAVYVSVPPTLHFEVVSRCLENGKHVLCEKPLANSVEEAKKLSELAKHSKLIHAMHFSLHYMGAIPRIYQLIQEGYIGKLRRIEIMLRFPSWPRPWQQVQWVGTKLQGGMVMEVSIHLLHAIQSIYGRFKHVETELEFPENPELCEQGVMGRMILQDGTPVFLNGLSQIAGKEEVISLTFFGSEGTLSMRDWDQLVGGRLGEEISEIEGVKHKSIFEEFNQVFLGKKGLLFDFESGYQVQKVMEALRGRYIFNS